MIFWFPSNFPLPLSYSPIYLFIYLFLTLVWLIVGRWTQCPVEGSQVAVTGYRWPNSKQLFLLFLFDGSFYYHVPSLMAKFKTTLSSFPLSFPPKGALFVIMCHHWSEATFYSQDKLKLNQILIKVANLATLINIWFNFSLSCELWNVGVEFGFGTIASYPSR